MLGYGYQAQDSNSEAASSGFKGPRHSQNVGNKDTSTSKPSTDNEVAHSPLFKQDSQAVRAHVSVQNRYPDLLKIPVDFQAPPPPSYRRAHNSANMDDAINV